MTIDLPKQGFFKCLVAQLEAPVSPGAFRFLCWLSCLCWQGKPLILPSKPQAEVYLADLCQTVPKTIRNYIHELVDEGFLVVVTTTRGYELYPVGVVPLPVAADQPLLDVGDQTASADEQFGKKFSQVDGKNFPKSRRPRSGRSSDKPTLPNLNSVVSKGDGSSEAKVGKKFSQIGKEISQMGGESGVDGKNFPNPAPPEFGKKIPKLVADKPAPTEEEPATFDTAQEAEWYAELKTRCNLFGGNVRHAVQKYIRAGASLNTLIAVAQRIIEECDADKRDGKLKDARRAATWRLAKSTPPLPDVIKAHADRERRETRLAALQATVPTDADPLWPQVTLQLESSGFAPTIAAAIATRLLPEFEPRHVISVADALRSDCAGHIEQAATQLLQAPIDTLEQKTEAYLGQLDERSRLAS